MFSFYFCLLNKTLPIVTHKPTDTPIKIPWFPPTKRLSGLPKETDGVKCLKSGRCGQKILSERQMRREGRAERAMTIDSALLCRTSYF
jgi:hypothetical protein